METRDTAILVIDTQEKLIRVIENKEMIVKNIKKLLEACFLLGVNSYFTEQNPLKLGKTISILLANNPRSIAGKMSFSCMECTKIIRQLKEEGVKNIILTGIETHVCVQQSALELIDDGFNVYIPIDGVGSRNYMDHEIAQTRIQSAGGVISTTESIIFELCKTADRKEFRSISKLIKE